MRGWKRRVRRRGRRVRLVVGLVAVLQASTGAACTRTGTNTPPTSPACMSPTGRTSTASVVQPLLAIGWLVVRRRLAGTTTRVLRVVAGQAVVDAILVPTELYQELGLEATVTNQKWAVRGHARNDVWPGGSIGGTDERRYASESKTGGSQNESITG